MLTPVFRIIRVGVQLALGIIRTEFEVVAEQHILFLRVNAHAVGFCIVHLDVVKTGCAEHRVELSGVETVAHILGVNALLYDLFHQAVIAVSDQCAVIHAA